MARPKLSKPSEGGRYFKEATPSTLELIPSGCLLLDLVLAYHPTRTSPEGGWPMGRIVNIVGDKAVGKTLIAIEAAANFAYKYPQGYIWYREAEAAFDESYAEMMGFPLERVDYGPNGPNSAWDTIEDIFEDLENCLNISDKKGQPGLYIVDSLDALSSRATLNRKIDEGSYRMEKQKILGELFSRLIRRIENSQVCIMIISQVRYNIGVTFGEKYTRSGGKSLDFYASHALWLSHMGNVNRTIDGVKRVVAVEIKARCKKNKVGLPFRECEFVIRFGYGVDDFDACLDWLEDVKRTDDLDLGNRNVKSYRAAYQAADDDERDVMLEEVHAIVRKVWHEIEVKFMPKRRKYR